MALFGTYQIAVNGVAQSIWSMAALDTKTRSLFSHQDPKIVEWFVQMVEERKKQHDSSKEKKIW